MIDSTSKLVVPPTSDDMRVCGPFKEVLWLSPDCIKK